MNFRLKYVLVFTSQLSPHFTTIQVEGNFIMDLANSQIGKRVIYNANPFKTPNPVNDCGCFDVQLPYTIMDLVFWRMWRH